VSAADAPDRLHSGHGWLAAVLPAYTRRVRTADDELAAVLAAAGAELVEAGGEVEIGRADELTGQAAFAVTTLDHAVVPRGGRAGRVARRVLATGELRLKALAARRGLGKRGYSDIAFLPWDVGHTLRLRGLRAGRPSVAERLPQRGVVVAFRGARPPTLFDAALEAASAAVGRPLQASAPSVRHGVLVATADDVVLRVAVGPDAGQVEAQLAALERLRAVEPEPTVADRVPWPLAHGRVGLAVWTLEQRLPGACPLPALPHPVVEQCVDFLAALHAAGGRDDRAPLAADAEVVASAASEPEAASALAAAVDATLAAVPRGFTHGDFFRGNLLVDCGRLVGVVDWDAAGPGRLPLTDLLHLRHYMDNRPEDDDWGPLLVERLLPWARRGGDGAVRDYLERVQVDPDPSVLAALVAAYWLEHASYQLRSHPHRREQPRWLARNVDGVLRTLEVQ
jgi:aminoglycoside phosphotransferase (APT) family kinase protein